MNERIRELLGQALDSAVPETWTTLSSEQLEKVYDKFALLIVRKCADLCYSTHDHKNILKHFGVE